MKELEVGKEYSISEAAPFLTVGLTVKTTGYGRARIDIITEGLIGDMNEDAFCLWPFGRKCDYWINKESPGRITVLHAPGSKRILYRQNRH